jgi:hypothetical protein
MHYDDKGKIFTEVVSKTTIPAIIQTLTNRLHGNIYVNRGVRLSDELNHSEKFMAVTDATVYDLAGQELYRCAFVAINREHVVWLMPEAEPRRDDDEGGGQ